MAIGTLITAVIFSAATFYLYWAGGLGGLVLLPPPALLKNPLKKLLIHQAIVLVFAHWIVIGVHHWKGWSLGFHKLKFTLLALLVWAAVSAFPVDFVFELRLLTGGAMLLILLVTPLTWRALSPLEPPLAAVLVPSFQLPGIRWIAGRTVLAGGDTQHHISLIIRFGTIASLVSFAAAAILLASGIKAPAELAADIAFALIAIVVILSLWELARGPES